MDLKLEHLQVLRGNCKAIIDVIGSWSQRSSSPHGRLPGRKAEP